MKKITFRRDPVVKMECPMGHELEIEATEHKIHSREYQDEIEGKTTFGGNVGGLFSKSTFSSTTYFTRGIFRQKYILCPFDGAEIEVGYPVMIKKLGERSERDSSWGEDPCWD